mgnify:CR=1 FL=1
MKKIFILIFFAMTITQAKHIEAVYDISYGLFGTLGNARATLETNATHYRATLTAKATGFAKFASNGLQEFYTSKGIIKKDTFIPQSYTEHTIKGHKNKKVTYVFNHKDKTVHSFTKRKDKKTTLQEGKRVSKWQERSYDKELEF